MEKEFLINDFFIDQNKVTGIDEEAYRHLENVRETIDTFSHIFHSCFYVIDYYKKNFFHVSDNNAYFGGCSSDEIRKMGYGFYFQYVPEEEIKMLVEINKVGFSFFNRLPDSEKPFYFISYNFHIRKDGNKMLVNHKLTPLKFSNGRIWLALCAFSPAASNQVGKVYLRRHDSPDVNYYSLQNKKWEQFSFTRLSDLEKRVFLCAIRGASLKETASEVFRSEVWVKKTRNKLLEMLDAHNFLEATHLALQYKLL